MYASLNGSDEMNGLTEQMKRVRKKCLSVESLRFFNLRVKCILPETVEIPRNAWDVVDGLDSAAEAFIGLLEGKNFGKLVVRIGADA